MLYREIIAVCSENYTKHVNALCGQNVELLNVKHGGIGSNYWALRVKASYFGFLTTCYVFSGRYRIQQAKGSPGTSHRSQFLL